MYPYPPSPLGVFRAFPSQAFWLGRALSAAAFPRSSPSPSLSDRAPSAFRPFPLPVHRKNECQAKKPISFRARSGLPHIASSSSVAPSRPTCHIRLSSLQRTHSLSRSNLSRPTRVPGATEFATWFLRRVATAGHRRTLCHPADVPPVPRSRRFPAGRRTPFASGAGEPRCLVAGRDHPVKVRRSVCRLHHSRLIRNSEIFAAANRQVYWMVIIDIIR